VFNFITIKNKKQNELHMEIKIAMFEIVQGHSTQQYYD